MLCHKCVSVTKMAEIARKSIIRMNKAKIENFDITMNTLLIAMATLCHVTNVSLSQKLLKLQSKFIIRMNKVKIENFQNGMNTLVINLELS